MIKPEYDIKSHKKYLYKISLPLEPLFLKKGNLMTDFFCIDRRKHGNGIENANNWGKSGSEVQKILV